MSLKNLNELAMPQGPFCGLSAKEYVLEEVQRQGLPRLPAPHKFVGLTNDLLTRPILGIGALRDKSGVDKDY